MDPIELSDQLSIPFFPDHTDTVSWATYDLSALIIHQGLLFGKGLRGTSCTPVLTLNLYGPQKEYLRTEIQNLLGCPDAKSVRRRKKCT